MKNFATLSLALALACGCSARQQATVAPASGTASADVDQAKRVEAPEPSASTTRVPATLSSATGTQSDPPGQDEPPSSACRLEPVSTGGVSDGSEPVDVEGLGRAIQNLQKVYKRKDIGTLAKRADSPQARREERLYALYLEYQLGNLAALQTFVKLFPLHADSLSGLNALTLRVSETCSGEDCMNPEMVLACAASQGAMDAEEKLLRFRAVTDTASTLYTEYGIAWLSATHPVEMVRLAACVKSPRILQTSIAESGIPTRSRANALQELEVTKFARSDERLVAQELERALAHAQEVLQHTPCELMTEK